jgi:hypothetical protein
LLCNYNALAGMPETAAETGHARKYAPELSPEHVAAGRRVRTLAMEKFLESPRAVLHRVCRFFEHEPDARELDVMSGDILQSHAKDPNQAYNREIRNLEYQRITQLHGDEITAVSDWVQPTLSSTDIEARLQKMAL